VRVLAVLAAAGLACGHAPPTGAPTGTLPALVTAYPALRWVPADAAFVITAPKVASAAEVLRNLGAIYGVLIDFDLSDADEQLQRWFGVNPMSADSLHDAGIDPDGGVAIWSYGGSPTIAIALSDPQRMSAFIDQLRGDAVVEVAREQGADVYTYRRTRQSRLHWVIADGWLFVHEEDSQEHEPELAWYRAARAAAGAYARGSDVTAAQSAAARLPGAGKPGVAPPVLAALNLATWLTRMKPYADKSLACLDLVSSVRRVGLAASIDGLDESGSITVELAGADPSSAALALPPGWIAAREGAPVQAEWTLDVDRVAAWLAPCSPQTARNLTDLGLRGGAAFVDTLDPDAMTGRGALWFVGHDTHLFDDVLDHIPGLSLVSHDRTVAGVAVTDVSAPMLPAFSFARSPTSVTLAIGAKLIDAILTGSAAPATHLAHLELHPNALPEAAWQKIFAAVPMLVPADDAFRAKTLRRLRRWDLARVDLDASPGVLVLTAHGRVHR
jgi:hypothetical protein